MRCSVLVLAAACSAAPLPDSLVRAESLERSGRDEEALAAYREAAARCDPRTCGAALRGEAATLERLGRAEEAAAAWERIPPRLPDDPATAAAALRNAGILRLKLHEDARAYDLMWRTIILYPDQSAADDALRHVVADGRRRNPAQLVDALARLYAGLPRTELGDNLLWEQARVLRDDLGENERALALLDQLVATYPQSPTLDDALWRSAQIARELKDPEGAVRRLRALQATREPPTRLGAYISPYLPKAQLLIGLILRDDLGRPAEALPEMQRVDKVFPESSYLDDTLYEMAVTYDRLGDAAGVCKTLSELSRRFPESKYEIERAPALGAKHGCGDKR